MYIILTSGHSFW